MSRSQSLDDIYSVLYVDFDNIYTRLFEQDPQLARTFATNPQRWLRWLEGHAIRMMYGEGVRRRILKRCCYLNPIRFHEFRPFFIRSAFQVVDCPPLTNFGKTSADIHLVMDCMDALAHVTRFDEFIILSGDADFTPLLLRIQEHARRTLMLSVGYTSPAYAAACSWRIREDWFLAQALEDNTRDEQVREERDGARPEQAHGERRAAAARNEATLEKSVAVNLPAAKRVRLVESIKQLVTESNVPVPLPSVAQVLQREQEATPDWFGAGTLRDLLEALDMEPVVLSNAGQGFVYDPIRHDKPESDDLREEFKLRYPQMYDLALKVHRLTDVPLLSPEQYGNLFAMLAEEVNGNGFSRTGTVRRLEDLCEDEGLPITSPQIAFVVEAVIRGGITLARATRGNGLDPLALREAFADSATALCDISQISLEDKERALLNDWLRL